MTVRAAVRTGVVILFVAMLPACTVKYTYNQLEDAWFDRELQRGWKPPMEFGFAPPNYSMGSSGVAFAAEWSLQDLSREAVPPLDEFDFVSLNSLSLSARFLPIDRGPFRPYFGAGYGRSTLKTHWKGPNYNRELYDCYGACTSWFERTLFSAWHPYFLGGLEVYGAGDGSTTILLEYRRQTGRSDDFYNFDGHSFSAGLRWNVPGGSP